MNDGEDKVRERFAAAEDIDLPEELGPAPSGHNGPPSDDEPPPHDDDDGGAARGCALLPLNDVGNGQRFAAYFGADALWVPRVGWFVWTGKVWKTDPDDIAVRRLGQKLGDMLLDEIPLIELSEDEMKRLAEEDGLRQEQKSLEGRKGEDGKVVPEAMERLMAVNRMLDRILDLRKTLSGKRKEHRSFARTTGNSARIDAALREGGIGLSHELDALDAAPLDVNTASGVLRFTVEEIDDRAYAEVELVPHERTQLLTKIMPVEYDPEARAPAFDAFLERVQPDVRMRRFLQRWFGLSMTALTGEQKLAFLYGGGANGKSVLMDLLARIAGEYATTAKIESLTGQNRRGGGDATPDLVPLMGARLVRASEPEEGAKLQEAIIKELTGGEKMLVRALNKDFVEVRPLFKITISGNHKPEIRGTDDGIWRRVMLVPFDVQIPEGERDKKLGDKLWEERSGILNWLVAGLLDYLEGGLQEPDSVLDATKEYREQSDPVGAFLEACCVVSGEARDSLPARDLVQAFNYWRHDQGDSQWGDGTVSRRLKDKASKWRSPGTGQSFIAVKASTMSYRGIRFNDIFGQRFREAPRDHQGRPLHGRAREDVE